MVRVLEQARWNHDAAARSLGISVAQLRYRLRQWGME
ncbi:helix-turn-helix domain-containing protein [Thauera aromatica]|nr:helix-turn-helix domain-containing protein [Thauera aromatica]